MVEHFSQPGTPMLAEEPQLREGGYGPVRRKEDDVGSGITLQPVAVEDAVMQGANNSGDEDGEAAPYAKPQFAPLKPSELRGKRDLRRVPVPPHRMTPLKTNWMAILQPLVEHMKLQVRMNVKRRCVELRTSEHTQDVGALQKAADFLKAFMLGFSVDDAIALLRLDDLFVETFEVHDVKRLQGDHLSRCVGRIAGKDGKTKHAIENATRTRISLAEERIHILGSFSNIKLARDSICSLILGSAPGKVYTRLRTVSKRLQERI